MPAVTVAELALACEGTVDGDENRIVSRANALDCAEAEDLSFVANEKALRQAAGSRAGCLIVAPAFDIKGEWSLIRVSQPRSSFAKALALLYPARRRAAVIHSSAVIAGSAILSGDCAVGAGATIGEHTTIGVGCSIGAGVHIGVRVRIGDYATIHPQVTIYDEVEIGTRVIVHAGTVIGADGFGFTLENDHYEKFPQVGTVSIGDDVEIGANCCVDRAALGVTRIGEGTKLDNLVHVAHNCSVGRHVVIAAQTGLAGGVTIGDYAVIGGQVGMGEKARIADRAIVGSGSGILSFQRVSAGEPVWGTPARPLRKHLKALAQINKLPALKDEVRAVELRLSALETDSIK